MTPYNTNDQLYANTQTKLQLTGQYTFQLTNIGQYNVNFYRHYKKLN